jgi:hypothetical protein
VDDDLRTLRELRRFTPTLSPRVRNTARAKLMTELTAVGRRPQPVRRRPRFALRAIAAGGLVVAVAAAITVAQNIGVDHRHAGTGGVLGGSLVANAQELGDTAARVVAAQPYKPPGPHQWVYTKDLQFDPPDTTPHYTEGWGRCDGKMVADYTPSDPGLRPGKGMHPGKLEEFATNAFGDADFSKVPTDPAVLLTWAATERKREGDKALQGVDWAGNAFVSLSALLDRRPPPALAAAAFRALASIPGVTARKDAVDALGRHGVAFALDQPAEKQQMQLILDPRTYRYLGGLDVMLAGNELNIKPGTVYSSSAEMTYAIVDHPGQRP